MLKIDSFKYNRLFSLPSTEFVACLLNIIQNLIMGIFSDLSFLLDFFLSFQCKISYQLKCLLLILFTNLLKLIVFLLTNCQLTLYKFCQFFLWFFSLLRRINDQFHQWRDIFFESWWDLFKNRISELLLFLNLLFEESGLFFNVINELIFSLLSLINFWLNVKCQLLG